MLQTYNQDSVSSSLGLLFSVVSTRIKLSEETSGGVALGFLHATYPF